MAVVGGSSGLTGFAASQHRDVERVRHLAHCFYYSRVREIAKEEHISDTCADEGFRLAEIDKRIRREMVAIYGNPEYGSWPDSAHIHREKRFEELEEKTRLVGKFEAVAREDAARDTLLSAEVTPEPETPFDTPQEKK